MRNFGNNFRYSTTYNPNFMFLAYCKIFSRLIVTQNEYITFRVAFEIQRAINGELGDEGEWKKTYYVLFQSFRWNLIVVITRRKTSIPQRPMVNWMEWVRRV